MAKKYLIKSKGRISFDSSWVKPKAFDDLRFAWENIYGSWSLRSKAYAFIATKYAALDLEARSANALIAGVQFDTLSTRYRKYRGDRQGNLQQIRVGLPLVDRLFAYGAMPDYWFSHTGLLTGSIRFATSWEEMAGDRWQARSIMYQSWDGSDHHYDKKQNNQEYGLWLWRYRGGFIYDEVQKIHDMYGTGITARYYKRVKDKMHGKNLKYTAASGAQMEVRHNNEKSLFAKESKAGLISGPGATLFTDYGII